jgi:hypothetical protein
MLEIKRIATQDIYEESEYGQTARCLKGQCAPYESVLCSKVVANFLVILEAADFNIDCLGFTFLEIIVAV